MPNGTVDEKKMTPIYDIGDGLLLHFHQLRIKNLFDCPEQWICNLHRKNDGKTSEPISVLPQDQFYYISVEVQSCLKKPILFFPQP